MPVTSLAFVAKNPTLVVKEVIIVAVIALEEGTKGMRSVKRRLPYFKQM
jgi:hypothetical protein